jgi:hypothetical protein
MEGCTPHSEEQVSLLTNYFLRSQSWMLQMEGGIGMYNIRKELWQLGLFQRCQASQTSADWRRRHLSREGGTGCVPVAIEIHIVQQLIVSTSGFSTGWPVITLFCFLLRNTDFKAHEIREWFREFIMVSGPLTFSILRHQNHRWALSPISVISDIGLSLISELPISDWESGVRHYIG